MVVIALKKGMYRIFVSTTLFFIVFLGSFFGDQTPASNSQEGEETMFANIEVQLSRHRQAWQGFGVSGAWWAQVIGECSTPTQQTIVNALFDREDGIGLNIYRYNVGGGEGHSISDPWRSAQSFEVGAGEYDWTHDAAALAVMRQAVEAGVDTVIAFANSPTARMTVSGTVDGHSKGRSNFQPGMEQEFARYLVDVADFLVSQGFPVKEISPINEPQWDWNPSKGQEGCHYTPEECVPVVRALVEEVEARGKDYEVAAIDSGDWRRSRRYLDALMDDPLLSEQLHAFHLHSYWSDQVDKERIFRYVQQKYPGLQLVMSEWTQMQSGRDVSMDSGLEMARVIWQDLTIGGVVSWQYWIGVSRYDFTDGLLYVDFQHADDTQPQLTMTKRLAVMGQFSRFIRPGAVRLEVLGDFSFLKPVAFLHPDGSGVSVVLVNDSPLPVDVSVGFDKETGFKLEQVFLTDEWHQLESVVQEPPQETTGGTFGWNCPPRSVTTLVFE